MKILFYSHSSTLYGATTSLINLISGILKIAPKTKVHVIIPTDSPLNSYLDKENIPYTVIPHYYWIYNYELSEEKRKRNFILWKLWYFKNKFQKEIGNRRNMQSHLKFVEEFKPDFIYVNSSLSPMGALVALKLNIPLIWHHRETLNDHKTGFFLEQPVKFRKIYKKTFLHIYPSNFLKGCFKKFTTNGKEIVINNGVRFKDSPQDLNKTILLDKLRFGIVGRINSQKDQDGVIKQFRNLKNNCGEKEFKHELHVMGGGVKEYIDEIKNKYPSEKIKFHGFLNQQEIFRKIDFLISNAKNESFGRVVAEANFYGIPVIALNSGALSEIVFLGINGYLYNSPSELGEILKDITCNITKEKYDELSKLSRKTFIENFTIEEMSVKIFKEIEQFSN